LGDCYTQQIAVGLNRWMIAIARRQSHAAPSRFTISDEALLAHAINSSSVIAVLLPLSSPLAEFVSRKCIPTMFDDLIPHRKPASNRIGACDGDVGAVMVALPCTCCGRCSTLVV
jgi:hypothetical protein